MVTKATTHVRPDRALHPGKMLGWELRARHITRAAFAAAIGLQRTSLTDIILGSAPITSGVAAGLERELETPAYLWLNLQVSYDEDLRRLNPKQ